MRGSHTRRLGAGMRGGLRLAAALGSVLAFAAAAHAQGSRPEIEVIDPGSFQITLLGGYQYAGGFEVDGGRVDIDAGPSAGVQLSFRTQDDGFVYASYTRQYTTSTLRYSDATPDRRFDLDVGVLQFGGELDLRMSKRLVPFIGLGIGATHFTPRNVSGGKTDWFFSGTAIGGLKVPIAKHIGLRAQARFIGTVISSNASWYCISAGGATCGLSLSDTKGSFQGDIMGGLYVAF